MYADDTQVYFECDDLDQGILQLNNFFTDVKRWASKNYLKLNQSKSKLLVLSREKKQYSIIKEINSKISFSSEQKVKNLGILLDNNLTFKDQINSVCRKGFHMLRNLWKVSSKISDVNLKIQIVQSCILSPIDYCNSLYVFLPKNQVSRLQRLINASVRFIYNLRKHFRPSLSTPHPISITSFTKKCHFLPMEARIHFKICILVYKCLNNNAPIYLQNLLSIKNSLPSLRISKDNYLLQPVFQTLNYKQRSFSAAAPAIWNMLPYELRSSTSIGIFKKNLKTYFFQLHYD